MRSKNVDEVNAVFFFFVSVPDSTSTFCPWKVRCVLAAALISGGQKKKNPDGVFVCGADAARMQREIKQRCQTVCGPSEGRTRYEKAELQPQTRDERPVAPSFEGVDVHAYTQRGVVGQHDPQDGRLLKHQQRSHRG